jgi:hypothetical protein
VKKLFRDIVKQVTIMVIMAAIFSACFILGHLAVYQELPRWK